MSMLSLPRFLFRANGAARMGRAGVRVAGRGSRALRVLQTCGDTGMALIGLPRLRPLKMMSISKRQKTVSRAYGGTLCGNAVRERIIRAFLIEEQKIVKKVLKKKAE